MPAVWRGEFSDVKVEDVHGSVSGTLVVVCTTEGCSLEFTQLGFQSCSWIYCIDGGSFKLSEGLKVVLNGERAIVGNEECSKTLTFSSDAGISLWGHFSLTDCKQFGDLVPAKFKAPLSLFSDSRDSASVSEYFRVQEALFAAHKFSITVIYHNSRTCFR